MDSMNPTNASHLTPRVRAAVMAQGGEKSRVNAFSNCSVVHCPAQAQPEPFSPVSSALWAEMKPWLEAK